MFFLLPLIGAAVGAVAGACISHANGDKNRQLSKHHRQVANKLSTDYSNLQKRHHELANNTKKQVKEQSSLNQQHINELTRKHAVDETEKDLLRLTIRLQQSLYILMWNIDENPTKESLSGFEQAVLVTNKVLLELKEEIIEVPVEYFSRNLERSRKIGTRHPLESIQGNNYPIKQCQKCGRQNRICPHDDNHSPICGNCKSRLAGEIIESEPPDIKIEPTIILKNRELIQISDLEFSGTFANYSSRQGG